MAQLLSIAANLDVFAHQVPQAMRSLREEANLVEAVASMACLPKKQTSAKPASPATMEEVREDARQQMQQMEELVRVIDTLIERPKEPSLVADAASTE
jgi:hypothetical protein